MKGRGQGKDEREKRAVVESSLLLSPPFLLLFFSFLLFRPRSSPHFRQEGHGCQRERQRARLRLGKRACRSPSAAAPGRSKKEANKTEQAAAPAMRAAVGPAPSPDSQSGVDTGTAGQQIRRKTQRERRGRDERRGGPRRHLGLSGLPPPRNVPPAKRRLPRYGAQSRAPCSGSRRVGRRKRARFQRRA